LLAIDFDRVAELDRIPNPFALYLGIGRIDIANAAPHLLRGYGGPEPFSEEYPAEYLALCHLCNYMAGNFHRYQHIIESAYPGVLSKVSRDANWSLRRYRGSGAFDSTHAFEDHDLYRFLSGDDRGDCQTQFIGAASPAIKARWKGFRKEVEGSLSGNQEWEILLSEWLGEVEDEIGEGGVLVQVHNPCDLLGTLIHGWPERMDDYLPSIFGFAQPESGHPRQIRGALIWTGRGRDIYDAFRLVYPDTTRWYIQKSCGLGWLNDQMLLHHLGLQYVLLEQIGPNQSDPSLTDEYRVLSCLL
ncbi:hypothetical protein ACFXOX_23720, partial [Bacillus subtilis]